MTITDDMNRLLKNQQQFARKLEQLTGDMDAIRNQRSAAASPPEQDDRSKVEMTRHVHVMSPFATGFFFGCGFCIAALIFYGCSVPFRVGTP